MNGRAKDRARDRGLRGLIALTLAVFWLVIWCGLPQPVAGAVFEERRFPNELTRIRYKALIEELRCLVCQNQNIADSDAELAADLRGKVFELLLDGRSDTEIMDFMVKRYGDFVLYRPPIKAVTGGLWAGPALLLAGGIGLLVYQVRRQRLRPAESDDSQDRTVRKLLAEPDEATDSTR